jgi:hypothetical protein
VSHFMCCNAQCHYAECYYAECRGAFKIFVNVTLIQINRASIVKIEKTLFQKKHSNLETFGGSPTIFFFCY